MAELDAVVMTADFWERTWKAFKKGFIGGAVLAATPLLSAHMADNAMEDIANGELACAVFDWRCVWTAVVSVLGGWA